MSAIERALEIGLPIILAACSARPAPDIIYTEISDLINNCDRHIGQKVDVKGRVTPGKHWQSYEYTTGFDISTGQITFGPEFVDYATGELSDPRSSLTTTLPIVWPGLALTSPITQTALSGTIARINRPNNQGQFVATCGLSTSKPQ